jgi:hypothetical protein
MLVTWWWIWLAVMLVFFITPMGYGWGYRGWGPPYPSYIQRRRHERASAGGAVASRDHYAWGWGGDLLWMLFLIEMIWVITAFWWR